MTSNAFDYVIIGGGAAGTVLAARLSEELRFSVALIEAGPDTPPGREPADILDSYPIVAYFNRAYHWQNLQVHLMDPEVRATAPRRYEQAKVMGGGTSINGMFAFRGLPSDFAEWQMKGAEGWAWDDAALLSQARTRHDLRRYAATRRERSVADTPHSARRLVAFHQSDRARVRRPGLRGYRRSQRRARRRLLSDVDQQSRRHAHVDGQSLSHAGSAVAAERSPSSPEPRRAASSSKARAPQPSWSKMQPASGRSPPAR